MASNQGFVFFYDWKRPLAKIPPKEFKELILATIEYAECGTLPESISPKAEIAADFIFSSIKRGNELSRKRSAAGKSGNAKRWDDSKLSQTVANDSSAMDSESQTIATKQNKDKININITPPLPPSPGGEAADAAGRATKKDDGFDRFWAAYPRKEAKKDARAAWNKLRPDDALIDTMLAAIEAKLRAAGGDWQREGGRFIPLPATWLRGERWNDTPTEQPEHTSGGSFDTDSFFLDALKRTYGGEAAG